MYYIIIIVKKSYNITFIDFNFGTHKDIKFTKNGDKFIHVNNCIMSPRVCSVLLYLLAGMITFEVMLAHMFTQMLIVVVQDALLLVFVLIVFEVGILDDQV